MHASEGDLLQQHAILRTIGDVVWAPLGSTVALTNVVDIQADRPRESGAAAQILQIPWLQSTPSSDAELKAAAKQYITGFITRKGNDEPWKDQVDAIKDYCNSL